MGKITVYDWSSGFNKVGHTNLLRAELGYSLSKAKAFTDAVLDRQPVTFDLPDDQMERMAVELSQLGAKFEVGEIGALNQTRAKKL